MKQFLLCVLLFGLAQLTYSQNDTYFIKWEGVSKEGHVIYGVSYTKEEAQFVIDDFNERNANTKYKIVFQFLKKRTTNDEHLVRKFHDVYPKKYRVLRALENTALHIFKIGNFEKAVDFITENSDKAKAEAEKYMYTLLKEFRVYRLDQRAL